MKKYPFYFLCCVTVFFFSCKDSGKTNNEILVNIGSGSNVNKPNIIYILADDLGYGDLSIYGQEKFETPNIDKLASQGMLFTQHYSGSTVCAPSRSALLTGMHTGHTVIPGNKEIQPEGQHPTPDDGISFLPTLFGNEDDQGEHEYLYWEFHEKGGRQAARKGDWKAVKFNVLKDPNAPLELYDLSEDIGEENNIAAEYPEVVEEMEAILDAARTPSDVFAFDQGTHPI